MKRAYGDIVILTVTLVLVMIFVAFWIAPAKSDTPQALLALLSKPQVSETWKVLTDLEAPIDSEKGPTSYVSCLIQGGMRAGFWVSVHMPGWSVKEWRCIPVTEVQSFLKRHAGADI